MRDQDTSDGTVDREHSVMRRQVIVLEVEYDFTVDSEPQFWDWNLLADLGPHEHAVVLAAGPNMEVSG